ncbi:MAG: retroviral-like aspartic protease family protein [Gammaproteobacteria bacterium]|nr:retroviral-like aspartic protease family protein [Gammaproteobacteria bacterium]
MPIIEAGVKNSNDQIDPIQLVQVGPSIEVSIGHFRTSGAPPIPPKEDVFTFALVDTGATESCIDISLAQNLDLPVVDKMTISGVGGAKTHDVYMAQIHIPDLKFTQYGKFAGVDLDGGGQLHKALLGRSFLQNTIMIYDGLRGQVTITVT